MTRTKATDPHLAEIIAAGRNLHVECVPCGHQVTLTPDRLLANPAPKDWPLSRFSRALICTKCRCRRCNVEIVIAAQAAHGATP